MRSCHRFNCSLGPWTCNHSTHLEFADIDLEAVLSEDCGDTFDEPSQCVQVSKLKKNKQFVHELEVRHIDFCANPLLLGCDGCAVSCYLDLPRCYIVQGKKTSTPSLHNSATLPLVIAVLVSARGSPTKIFGAALKLGRRLIARGDHSVS